MSANPIVRWGGARLSRRAARSMPWIGAAVALATVFSTMKRKGVLRGGLDTALSAVPYLGAVKGMAEEMRGRDFLADRAAIKSLPR